MGADGTGVIAGGAGGLRLRDDTANAVRPRTIPSRASARISSNVIHGIGGAGFFTMTRVNGVDLVAVPFEPTIESGYVPLAASAPTLILIIELAVLPTGGLGAGGVKVTVT